MAINQATHHQKKEEVGWTFKVIRRFQTPMYRQISEYILIRQLQGKGSFVLNKKEEYSRSILPQLEVSIGGKMVDRSTKARREPISTEGGSVNSRAEGDMETVKAKGCKRKQDLDITRRDKRMRYDQDKNLNPSIKDSTYVNCCVENQIGDNIVLVLWPPILKS